MNDLPLSISRRNFLSKSLAGAGAGLLLGAPNILRAQTAGSADNINVALIGMGKQGRVLFEAMSNIPGLHFQAVCDIWDYNRNGGVAKVNALQGSRPNAYVDVDEMLATEKGLDAVVIATPDFWHSPHTVKCLEAGLHVYCEKMMSDTIDGARAMVHAMEKSGKLCQIGHQRRSNPRYRFVLDNLIRGQKICGQITNVNGQWNRAVSSSQDLGFNPKLTIKQDILEKYGFKSIKSIVEIKFVEKMPETAWHDLQPSEYGFFSNVNPAVDHPRWSQKTERRIAGEASKLFAKRIPTLPFNGYAAQVASMYAGLDLKKWY